MSALRTGRRIGHHGTTAMEFAMLAPILLVLALGVIEFGYQAAVASALDFGARAGGRVGITGSGSAAEQVTQREKDIRSAVLGASGGLLTDGKLKICEASYSTIADAKAADAAASTPLDCIANITGAGSAEQYVRYKLTYASDQLVGKWIGDIIGRNSFTYGSTVLVKNEPFPIY